MWQQSSYQSCPVCWLHWSALRSDSAPRPGTVDLGPGLRRRTRWPPSPAASWPAESRWDCRESASSHSDHQHSDPSSPTEHQTGFHCKPSETPQLLGLKTRGKFCILTNLQVQTVEVMWPTDDFTLKVMKNDITMTSWGLFRQTWDTQDVTNWLVRTWTWVGRWAPPLPSPVRAQTDDWLLCSPLWVTTTIRYGAPGVRPWKEHCWLLDWPRRLSCSKSSLLYRKSS